MSQKSGSKYSITYHFKKVKKEQSSNFKYCSEIDQSKSNSVVKHSQDIQL